MKIYNWKTELTFFLLNSPTLLMLSGAVLVKSEYTLSIFYFLLWLGLVYNQIDFFRKFARPEDLPFNN